MCVERLMCHSESPCSTGSHVKCMENGPGSSQAASNVIGILEIVCRKMHVARLER